MARTLRWATLLTQNPVGAGVNRSLEYEFLVAERLSPTAIAASDELSASHREGAGTVLSGTVRDQSHLYGLLARFQSLGLTVEGLTKLQDSSRP